MFGNCKKIWCFTKKYARVYPSIYCNSCFSNISHLHQFDCGHYICIRCVNKLPNKKGCKICSNNVFYAYDDKNR